ncbi:MAG: response regulator transcription factor [Cyclobacteriaceae bacterium]|nr:response regulator transcription factor [Cyclobacteriaceae bacterium]
MIDDEPHARGAVEEMIEKHPKLQWVASFASGQEALLGLEELNSIDFIFSDIDMPEINGIELGKTFKNYCRWLIYITAHDAYALEAYDLLADAFLLKPVAFSTFLEKINHIIDKQRLNDSNYSNAKDYMFIKAGANQAYLRIDLNRLICIDAGDHYPTLITEEKKFTVYTTMKQLEEELTQRSEFVRIHRSCIISINYVEKIEGNTISLRMDDKDNTRFVSASYRDMLFKLLLGK